MSHNVDVSKPRIMLQRIGRFFLAVLSALLALISLGYAGCLPWRRDRGRPLILKKRIFKPSTATADKREFEPIREKFSSTARYLGQPLEDVTSKRGADRDNTKAAVSPVTTEDARRKRAQANAYIRDHLKSVPVEDLQRCFRINACTWNVDQRSPPKDMNGMLEWLLGKKLQQKVLLRRRQPSPTNSNSESAGNLAGENTSFKSLREAGAHNIPVQSPVAGNTRCSDSFLSEFPDMLIISLQEVDMGGMALVKELTKSSSTWADALLDALHLATGKQLQYKQLKVAQLVGLVLIVIVQAQHMDYISHVRLSITRTGAMHVLGNKGSVGLRATIYGKRFLIIAAHFSAHKSNEAQRSNNYHAAISNLRFELPEYMDDESEILLTYANANTDVSAFASFGSGQRAWDRLFRGWGDKVSVEVESQVLDQHDYVFFLGDLNSRLHSVTSTEIRERIAAKNFDRLLCFDELRQGMISGETFCGFREAWIYFAPTYKFDRNSEEYDTSYKQRDPAWTDRVLFRTLTAEAAGSSCLAECQEAKIANADKTDRLATPPTKGGARVQTLDPCHVIKETARRKTERAAQSSSTSASSSSTSTSSSSSASPRESLRASKETKVRGALHDATTSPTSARDEAHVGHEQRVHRKLMSPPTSPIIPIKCAPWAPETTMLTFNAASRPLDERLTPVRFPMVSNTANAVNYTNVPSLKQSDHRPVLAQFEVKIMNLSPPLVMRLLGEVEEKIMNDSMSPSSHAR